MRADPDHPASEQAFTTFPVPGRPSVLVVLASSVVLLTLWQAVCMGGSFVDTPGPMRTAVVLSVGYLAVRAVRAGVAYWRLHGGRRGLGPEIERIEP